MMLMIIIIISLGIKFHVKNITGRFFLGCNFFFLKTYSNHKLFPLLGYQYKDQTNSKINSRLFINNIDGRGFFYVFVCLLKKIQSTLI